MMNEKLEQAIIKYSEKLGENFPIYLFADYTDDEIIKLINQCIDQKKPAEEVADRDYDGLDQY